MCTQVVRKQQQSQEKVCREAGVANLHSAPYSVAGKIGIGHPEDRCRHPVHCTVVQGGAVSIKHGCQVVVPFAGPQLQQASLGGPFILVCICSANVITNRASFDF